MQSQPNPSIIEHFSSITDPRLDRKKRHKLIDIFFITLCGVICGADSWVAIEQFGKAKYEWLKHLLELKNGIPSHDTFGNVFAMIDPEEFSQCFSSWVADLAQLCDGEVVAIDGKCLRRSMDTASNKSAIYMVSAWANKNQLVIGQQKVEDKSNEITAIPKLLEQLDIAGAVITIDAMGCQTAITHKIIEQKADYLLSLKGNQGTLHEDVKLLFESEKTCPEIGHETYDGGHGRVETRTIRALSNIDWIKETHPDWKKLNSVISITYKREEKNKVSEETRYFISSLDATDPKYLGQIARAHWSIENNLHWVLDYAFDEDSQRMRYGNSAANMAIIRHISLNLLKLDKTLKVGIKNKRLKAGWDQQYLLSLLFSNPINNEKQ